MKPSELNSDVELKGLLSGHVQVNNGSTLVAVPVYSDSERSDIDLPDDFVEISHNGSASATTMGLSLVRGNLMLALYCKLFEDGSVKKNRVAKLLEQIEVYTNKVSSTHYFYELDLDRFITPTTADYTSGYSVTVLNIRWRQNSLT